jgi:ABC-type uncharacterized transport system permease subunit
LNPEASSFQEGLSGAVVRSLKAAVPSLIALGLGIVAASVLMLAFRLNPINVFATLFSGALQTQFGQSSVLTYMGSYILLALAFLIPGKAGIWNVGGQGQAFLGGITAALIVVFIPLPPGIWPLVAVAGACVAGGLWAALPGVLEAYRSASAIVTTIMLNFVAQSFSSFLLFYVIESKVGVSVRECNCAYFPGGATIPTLPYFNTSIMFIVAIVVAIVSTWFLSRTTTGYKIRATGLGTRPAESKGINPRKTKVIAMTLGGVVAGLAGAGDVLSVGRGCYQLACYQDGFAAGWFGGEGFAGIAVALVAVNNPIGSIFSAIFFSILAAGTAAVLQDIYVVWAMQGIIILFMAAPQLSKGMLKLRGRRKWI